MVVKLEDFLRRRSKIALVVREEEIRAAPGLREACRILFAGDAEAKIAEYMGTALTRQVAAVEENLPLRRPRLADLDRPLPVLVKQRLPGEPDRLGRGRA